MVVAYGISFYIYKFVVPLTYQKLTAHLMLTKLHTLTHDRNNPSLTVRVVGWFTYYLLRVLRSSSPIICLKMTTKLTILFVRNSNVEVSFLPGRIWGGFDFVIKSSLGNLEFGFSTLQNILYNDKNYPRKFPPGGQLLSQIVCIKIHSARIKGLSVRIFLKLFCVNEKDTTVNLPGVTKLVIIIIV